MYKNSKQQIGRAMHACISQSCDKTTCMLTQAEESSHLHLRAYIATYMFFIIYDYKKVIDPSPMHMQEFLLFRCRYVQDGMHIGSPTVWLNLCCSLY